MQIILIILISLCGLVGFLLASYIHRKKKSKKKLICPMRSNCDTVIHSDYSKIIGIPVEILGMIYYVFISLVYGVIFILSLWSVPIAIVLLGVSMCSVFFSLYLVSLQALIIRQWCVWCMCSAGISILILFFSYIHFSLY
ncbi:hypothetical protein K8Q96_02925 [Candidatus Nomurabacteria bacterium]|nr:hypothetical protein [Candidatus Nomurabacteria bacterium]